ncbi:MAG: UDP-N-acetylmuramate--L-alanine ligase [Thermodesulfovibrionales bacterium]
MYDRPQKLFFSGIAGSGVSAIACFMADKGQSVSGSDRSFENNQKHPLYNILKAKGINITPQDGSGIDSSLDLVVFSTAVEHDSPEFTKVKTLKIPFKTRPEYLAELTIKFKTIAISGTSGKSTTAGMLAFLMHRLGMEPNFIGGGRVKQFKKENHPGNSLVGNSDILVVEACESDGTIVKYKPEHLILLNLHLDHNPVDITAEMFRSVIKNTNGLIVFNADDQRLKKIIVSNAVTFSVDSPSKYKAIDIKYNTFSTEFSLDNIRFTLSLPGKYNLYNALSCIAILSEMGIPVKDISNIIHEFKGIERRFDVHLNNGKYLVIDDYAHNPHKILSLMKAMKNISKDICYIFQPHGFGPTRLMKDEYIEAFSQNLGEYDHLILLPIYYAGGSSKKDISSYDLAGGIKAKGKSVEVIEKRDEILKNLGRWNTYVVFGARDETLSDFAKTIAQSLYKPQ